MGIQLEQGRREKGRGEFLEGERGRGEAAKFVCCSGYGNILPGRSLIPLLIYSLL
jgi:hypothetical protein